MIAASFCDRIASVSPDEWLKRRAPTIQASGAARTFVVCNADKVVGYYALATGAVHLTTAPGRFRRNMPEPIPVVVLARFAIGCSYQGRSLGRALVRDAARRVVNAHVDHPDCVHPRAQR